MWWSDRFAEWITIPVHTTIQMQALATWILFFLLHVSVTHLGLMLINYLFYRDLSYQHNMHIWHLFISVSVIWVIRMICKLRHQFCYFFYTYMYILHSNTNFLLSIHCAAWAWRTEAIQGNAFDMSIHCYLIGTMSIVNVKHILEVLKLKSAV